MAKKKSKSKSKKIEENYSEELVYEPIPICKHCGRHDNADPDEHHVTCPKVPKCSECGSRDGPHICR